MHFFGAHFNVLLSARIISVAYGYINLFVVDTATRCQQVFSGSFAVRVNIGEPLNLISFQIEECLRVIKDSSHIGNQVFGVVFDTKAKSEVIVWQYFVATFYFYCWR